jgi:tetrahydromethanopterin S-methyltransferase subunit G
MPTWTISDYLKALGYAFFILLAWARVEAGIDKLSNRLDAIESAQIQFVRSDVATKSNDVLVVKLDALAQRLERIEDKLDK